MMESGREYPEVPELPRVSYGEGSAFPAHPEDIQIQEPEAASTDPYAITDYTSAFGAPEIAHTGAETAPAATEISAAPTTRVSEEERPTEQQLTDLGDLLGVIEAGVESYSSPYKREARDSEKRETLDGQAVVEHMEIWGESQGGKGHEGPTSDIYVTRDAQDGSTRVIRRDNVAGTQHELSSEEVHRLNYSLRSNEGRGSYSPFDQDPNLGPRPEVRDSRY